MESVNVFHHLFYEGQVDIYNINDPLKETATIGFINNFGQIPKQVRERLRPARSGCLNRPERFRQTEPSTFLCIRLFFEVSLCGCVRLSCLRSPTLPSACAVKPTATWRAFLRAPTATRSSSTTWTTSDLLWLQLKVQTHARAEEAPLDSPQVPHVVPHVVPRVVPRVVSPELKEPVGQIMCTDKGILAVELNKVLVPPTWSKTFAWGYADLSCRLANYESEKVDTEVFILLINVTY